MNQSSNSSPNEKTKELLLLWALSASILAVVFMAATLGLLLLLFFFHRSSVQEAGDDVRPPVVWERAPNPGDAATPATLETPPAPQLPDIYISDLQPLSFVSGWGESGVNKSVTGKPLMLEGKTYERGLGTHAYGEAMFDIPAGVRRFVAVVGLDDEVLDDEFRRGSVCFEVYGVVDEMAEAPVLLGKSPVLSPKTVRSWAMDLKLDPRFKKIQLVVSDAEDGNECDHADWVNAGFVK